MRFGELIDRPFVERNAAWPRGHRDFGAGRWIRNKGLFFGSRQGNDEDRHHYDRTKNREPWRDGDPLQRCYDLLELPVGSSYEEVKNAYRMMTKVWHPDRFAADTELRHKAEEKLKLINVAFQILQADLQKTQEKLKQIDLVYEILQDHLESTPSVGSSAEANQSPELPGGSG